MIRFDTFRLWAIQTRLCQAFCAEPSGECEVHPSGRSLCLTPDDVVALMYAVYVVKQQNGQRSELEARLTAALDRLARDRTDIALRYAELIASGKLTPEVALEVITMAQREGETAP